MKDDLHLCAKPFSLSIMSQGRHVRVCLFNESAFLIHIKRLDERPIRILWSIFKHLFGFKR